MKSFELVMPLDLPVCIDFSDLIIVSEGDTHMSECGLKLLELSLRDSCYRCNWSLASFTSE